MQRVRLWGASQVDLKTTGNQQDRESNGQFSPGQSGNPAGRSVGSKNKLSKIREEYLLPILPEAIEKLYAAVKDGDRWAIELVVSYSMSKPKPVDPDELEEFEQRLLELEEMAARKN
ncbi:MAG: hypothetical protein IH951_13795 [Bacteroidetes bacterium]|nr:hypothetical protein [Bacteroidota bacterium]